MSSTRRCWVGGNFKAAATKAIVAAQVELLNKTDIPSNTDVCIAPSALHLSAAAAAVKPGVGVLLQDVHTAPGLGAFTGSHTLAQAVDAGVPGALVGHSERRSIWGESDGAVGAKARLLVDAGLTAVVCVGESLAEREAGATLAVVTRQLEAVAGALGAPAAWARVVVAYEPVWAIGTGKVATPEQAQEAHAAIRKWLAERVEPAVAAATRVVYGGSVTAATAGALLAGADIDGFLVGGASLKPEFADIIKACAVKA